LFNLDHYGTKGSIDIVFTAAQNIRHLEVFMRLVSNHPVALEFRRTRMLALGLLCLAAALWCAGRVIAQDQPASSLARDESHQSAQWLEVQKHLPDPAISTAQALEEQADILRARRFPEDAMDYYRYAQARGGNGAALLNKLGLTELEMRNVELARSYFQRALKLNRKDSNAWNNLGAVEYIDKAPVSAINDYKKAIKADRRQAVYHANLATADFETTDYRGARREMTLALKLDPEVFDRKISSGGVEAHVLTSEDRARFSFEMAKLYARTGSQDQMLHSLAQAAEAGMDVRREMRRDPVLVKFEMDPRVLVLVHNAQMLHASRATAASASTPSGAATPTKPLAE
jgi:tetratricopeptide (TPR) repeat protein